MKVDGVTYCFDGNGIMYPGWVKLTSTTPEIKATAISTSRNPNRIRHSSRGNGQKGHG